MGKSANKWVRKYQVSRFESDDKNRCKILEITVHNKSETWLNLNTNDKHTCEIIIFSTNIYMQSLVKIT